MTLETQRLEELRGKIGEHAGDLARQDWGDLVAGGLEMTLETKRWKIGDDTGQLAAGRLGTMLET